MESYGKTQIRGKIANFETHYLEEMENVRKEN